MCGAVAKNLADLNETNLQDLYQSRLDGPITCHALVLNFGFIKLFLPEIGQVFTQTLYDGTGEPTPGLFVSKRPD